MKTFVLPMVLLAAALIGMAAPSIGDDYDRELLGDPAAKPSAGDEALRARLQRELGAAAQSGEDVPDPLVEVARQMGDARDRIARQDAGAVTQHLQSQIVADLDRIIEQAKKSPQPDNSKEPPGRTPLGKPDAGSKPDKGSSGGTAPNRPANQSDPNAKHAGDGRGPKSPEARSTWEQYLLTLPERQRDQLNQVPTEDFLPKYESQIEQYYRRLSDQYRKEGMGR